MNIVKPYAKIVRLGSMPLVRDPRFYLNEDDPDYRDFHRDLGISLLQIVEEFGRVSHRSEDRQTPESWDKFIRANVIQHGDWSITEHATVSVEALVDRGITHEWVRHRIGAYTQESTRFVNYEKKIPASFIKPEGVNATETYWKHAVQACEDAYKEMIHEGVAPQIARSVFPNALASKLIITYNLRNWRHFFIMRTTKEAHPQMRQVTIPLLEEFKKFIPILYDDIEPNARQVDNLKLPR